ncbi:MAG: VTC domain-containing protein, partial [Anaerotignaceae bacterium]
MSKVNYTFKRSEKKFLVNREVYNALFNEINEYILPDAYGNYTILNIYFDTEDNYLIRNSLEKPIYKEKLRLRSYGVPNSYDMVFLEIKKKYKGVVYKRRVSMQLSEAIAYINGESSYNHNSQIMKEIDYFFSHYDPMPKTFIAYEREAFYAKEDKDLRITVDSNIRSRNYDLSLCAGDYGEMLLKEDLYL